MTREKSITDQTQEIPDHIKKQVTFNITSIEEYKHELKNIHKTLEKHNFTRITGLIKESSIVKSKSIISNNFKNLKDHASIGEDPKCIQSNFSKLSIGGAQKYGVYRPRCLRTIYNPMWDSDIFSLHNSFEVMAKARNLLYGFDENFAIHSIEDEMWTASRVHHYPRGGGFLVSHKDIVVPKIHKLQGYKNFYQLVMVLSKKGHDFMQGGGFATLKGKKYFYENEANYGDIIIYDGRTIHGVADIDPEEPFIQQSPEGRMAAFVTLYKDIEKDYKIKTN